MKLYLVRHGEATPPEIEIRRPLNENGRNSVIRLANFLMPAGVLVSHVYHSDKLRSAETAEILASVVAPGQDMMVIPELNAPDAAADIADEVSGWVDDALLVGHIPLLPRLVSELITRNEDLWLIDFRPATMVCLERFDFDRWQIAWAISPDILPRTFSNA